MPPPRSTGLARRIASNTMHAASGRVVALALWLVLTPAMLRSLGADGFGVWSLFFALTGYLGALDLGFSQATLRFVSAARAVDDTHTGGEVATLSLMGYLVLGLLWALVIPALREPVLAFLRVSPGVRPGAAFAISAGAVVFTLVGFTNTCIAVLQGNGRFDLANLVLIAVSVVQAGGIVMSMRLGWGLQGMVTSTAVAWVCALLVSAVAILAAVPVFRWGSPAAALRRGHEVFRFGGPVQLTSVLGVMHQQADKVLLARFVALAAVAPYELGLRVATAASTFSQLLLLAMIPAASALHASRDRAMLERLYHRANRYVLTVSAVIMGAIVGSAGPMLAAWLGTPPHGAQLALRGLIVVGYLAIAGGVGGAIARGAGRTDLEAEFSAVAFALHLALGIALVPRFGLAGALVAIASGNLVGLVWFLSRLSGALSWARLPVMLEPFGWPLAILVAGAAAGVGCGRLHLPGLAGAPWPRFLIVGGSSALAGAAVALGSGFLSYREVLSLLAPGRSADA